MSETEEGGLYLLAVQGEDFLQALHFLADQLSRNVLYTNVTLIQMNWIMLHILQKP